MIPFARANLEMKTRLRCDHPLADQVSVAYWNVNSLGPLNSQKRFINKLKGMKDNIYILEDTRLNVGDEKPFKKLWGDMAYFNSYCWNRRGITALIKNGTPITDIEWENVIPGNFSKPSFRLNKQKTLLNAYTHQIKIVI